MPTLLRKILTESARAPDIAFLTRVGAGRWIARGSVLRFHRLQNRAVHLTECFQPVQEPSWPRLTREAAFAVLSTSP